MDLFNREGHITNEGLNTLVSGGLDELQRLEISEHLSFCDACLEAYMQRLEEGPLLTPEKPVKAAVMRCLWKKRLAGGLRRAGMVAAAACMAVGLWQAGSNALNQHRREAPSLAACCVLPEEAPLLEAQEGAAAALGRGLRSLTEGVHRALDGLFSFGREEEGRSSSRRESRQCDEPPPDDGQQSSPS